MGKSHPIRFSFIFLEEIEMKLANVIFYPLGWVFDEKYICLMFLHRFWHQTFGLLSGVLISSIVGTKSEIKSFDSYSHFTVNVYLCSLLGILFFSLRRKVLSLNHFLTFHLRFVFCWDRTFMFRFRVVWISTSLFSQWNLYSLVFIYSLGWII